MEEALQQANRKLHLLSTVTRHDVLNQLTVLLGYLEISQELGQSPNILDSLKKAEIAAENIRHQISLPGTTRILGSTALHGTT